VRVFNNVTGGAILRGMGTETMPEQHIGLEQGLINTGGFVRQLTALIVTGKLFFFFYFRKDKERFVSIKPFNL
jgi:hypothetical protein